MKNENEKVIYSFLGITSKKIFVPVHLYQDFNTVKALYNGDMQHL